MTHMHWLGLTLLSAFCLASADAVTKRYLSHYRPGELVLVRFGVTGLLLLPLLLVQRWPTPPLAFWGWVAALLPLEILAMWLYMRAIRESPLSLTLPYLAFTPVFNVATGYLFLGESVSNIGFAGILLVVFGAWLLNLDRVRAGRRLNVLAPFRAIAREQGSRLMLGTAALYSLTSVLGKGALQHVTPQFFGPFYFVLLALVATALFASRELRSWSAAGRNAPAHLLVGAFMAGMVLAHFYAIEHIEVAYMIAVKRTSLLFGLLYGAWLFGETGLARNLAAALLMVAGVYLIAA
jgi:drug/metabolite transporter (DMT)-like permease